MHPDRLAPILDDLAARPRLELSYSRRPRRGAGRPRRPDRGLARSFKVLDPEVKDPATSRWERAFRIFDLLL